jgi:hypothetical protein
MADSDLTNPKNTRLLTIWKKSAFSARLVSTEIVWQRQRSSQAVIASNA